jgi:hypothetical protein
VSDPGSDLAKSRFDVDPEDGEAAAPPYGVRPEDDQATTAVFEPYLPAGEPDPTEIHPDDPDDDWSDSHVKKGLRLAAPTAVLLSLVILAAGFWGGALAEKHHGSPTSSSSALSALASRLAAARGGSGTATGAGAGGGGGGFAGAGGGATPATAGIVTGVQGTVLYVTNASGDLVKVEVGPSTSVTRTAKSSLTGLQTGDTVVVQGTTGSGGTVTAMSVRATGRGVPTAGGGGLGAAFGNTGG